MAKVTIRSDGNGGAEVIGPIPEDNGFYEFALRKVLSGKFTGISWEPIPSYTGIDRDEITKKSESMYVNDGK